MGQATVEDPAQDLGLLGLSRKPRGGAMRKWPRAEVLPAAAAPACSLPLQRWDQVEVVTRVLAGSP